MPFQLNSKLITGYIKLTLIPLLLLNAGLALIIYNITFNNLNPSLPDETKYIVPRGTGFSILAEDLKSKGYIDNAFAFKLAAFLSGKQNDLIARKYIIEGDKSNSELIELFTNKDLIQTIRFRILEGYTIKRIAKVAQDKLSLDYNIFTEEAKDPGLISQLGLSGKVNNLEGFFFPDTYIVDISITEKDLAALLVDTFKRKVLDNLEISSKLNSSGKSLLEIITLASIAEAETNIDKELPIIAGVYYNRIKKNMRLEADPTVQYALPDGPKSRLLFEDLKINSPYNTYRNYGLPPGPINNPGLEAIKAALYPAQHNYLFFVATGEGGHTFNETFEQHKQDAQKYRELIRSQNENK